MTLKEIAVMFHNRARVLKKLDSRLQTALQAQTPDDFVFFIVDRSGKKFRVMVSQLEG